MRSSRNEHVTFVEVELVDLSGSRLDVVAVLEATAIGPEQPSLVIVGGRPDEVKDVDRVHAHNQIRH